MHFNAASMSYNSTHDWSECLASTDIHCVYDMFLNDVYRLIGQCIPKKSVTIKPRDPPYVTPLVTSMLVKRNRLRKKGRLEEANKLAEKINVCIQDVRTKQYSRMSQASPRELWAAVKATNGAHRSTEKPSYLLRDVERVNNYFASVCYDPSSSATHGICCSPSLCSPHNSNIVLQPYEVERLHSRMKASSSALDNVPHWFFFVHVLLKFLRLLHIF